MHYFSRYLLGTYYVQSIASDAQGEIKAVRVYFPLKSVYHVINFKKARVKFREDGTSMNRY